MIWTGCIQEQQSQEFIIYRRLRLDDQAEKPQGYKHKLIVAIDTCLTDLDTDRIPNCVQIRMIHEDKDKQALGDRARNARCRYTC